MSYQPVSGIVPQYSDDSNQLASGFYLKFYVANTTTPLSMATDSAGGTLLVKAKLNPEGLPISNPLDNDTVFIPHVDQSYRLVVYRTEDDANADNTAAAFLNVPSLDPLQSINVTSATGTQTVAEMGDARVVEVASIAEMEALSPEAGIAIQLTQDGRAGEFLVKSGTPPADPQKGIYITHANGNYSQRRYGNAFDLRWFGGTSGAVNNTILVDATALAASEGIYRVVVPFEELNVGAGSQANCSGCIVEGNNTTLTGDLINTVAAPGFVINSQRSSGRIWHPSYDTDDSNKIIIKVSANHYRIVVRKESKGWVLIDLKNNITTTFESLASTTSDITSFRVTGITNLVDAYVGYTTANAQTGTWSDVNLITGILESFDSGREYVYKQAQSGTAGIYYEMSINVPANGKFNVGFLRSSSSCTDNTITVDGVAVDSNFDLSSAAATVETREYTAEPGTRLVRVTKNLSTGLVNLLGCNFFRLDQLPLYVSTDSYGYYISTTNYNNYLSNTSANDYAIRDDDLDTWGGSYHGGETTIVTEWLIGGNNVTLSVGESRAARKLEVRQTFNIDWSGIGGPVLNAVSNHRMTLGGYGFEVSLKGSIKAESMFLMLYGIGETFDQVEAPTIVDLAALPDQTRAFYGRQNRYLVRNDTTGQYLKIAHSMFSDEENQKGGSYTYKVVGLYNKYYYAPIDRGSRTVDGISTVNVFKFG